MNTFEPFDDEAPPTDSELATLGVIDADTGAPATSGVQLIPPPPPEPAWQCANGHWFNPAADAIMYGKYETLTKCPQCGAEADLYL